MAADKGAKPRVDWEAMEPDWRAGFKSVLSLSQEYGVSRAAILKHWAKEGVERDLSAKIRDKTDSLVTQALVTPEVTPQSRVSERQTIESNAKMLADKILSQRTDIQRARLTVQRLWELVNVELDSPAEFERLGELLRSPDESNQDKLNDIYHAAISLPQHIKNAKLLSDSIKTLVELERKVLRIDEHLDNPDQGAGPTLNDTQRASRIAFLFAKAMRQC